jgi:hypothetical protein
VKEVFEMTTIPHEPHGVVHESESRSARLVVRELWVSLAIVVIWLAVLFDAIYGPNIVSITGSGGSGTQTTLPSAVVVSFFAFLATWAVARHGFDQGRKE